MPQGRRRAHPEMPLEGNNVNFSIRTMGGETIEEPISPKQKTKEEGLENS